MVEMKPYMIPIDVNFFFFFFQVLFESRSLVYGEFPACTCRKNVGEGYLNRLAYSWYGVTVGSFLFLLFALYVYEVCIIIMDYEWMCFIYFFLHELSFHFFHSNISANCNEIG